MSAGLAAAVLTLAVLVPGIMRGSDAVATSPPVLTFDPIVSTASDLLNDMAGKTGAETVASNVIRAQIWELDMKITEDGEKGSTFLGPRWSETVFEESGDVTVVFSSGEPFVGQIHLDLPAPGTIIMEEAYPAGSYQISMPEGPPSDVTLMGPYMALISGQDSLSAGEMIVEVSDLMSSTPLTGSQESAILNHLSTLEGISVAGRVTDRLGREGIGFVARDRIPGEVEDVLIVSPESGAIIGAETLYVGDDRTDIASPSVIDYTAWER